VKPGTAVKEGDQVLTLEAMKMNTVIYAPANGTVTSFCVAPGDTVAENQPLAYLG
jgi:biotin carboxyl carrier protein